MVRRGGSSSSSAAEYDDAWIKAKFATVDEAIKKAKNFNNFIYESDDKDFSLDHGIPFQIKRKNQRFEYLMLSLVVTNKSTEATLNQLGEYGWHTDAMSIVNEKSGTASFLFKLHLIGDSVSPIKFEYKCFSFEMAQSYKLQDQINELNKSGFEFIQTSAWNKTHSFAFLVKTSY